MLDALEAGIVTLRSKGGAPPAGLSAPEMAASVRSILAARPPAPAGNPPAAPPAPADNGHLMDAGSLDAWMKRAALSQSEFSKIFGVHPATLRRWLSGVEPAPDWVAVSIRIYTLLTPAERLRLLKNGKSAIAKHVQRTHPFSRIEEL